MCFEKIRGQEVYWRSGGGSNSLHLLHRPAGDTTGGISAPPDPLDGFIFVVLLQKGKEEKEEGGRPSGFAPIPRKNFLAMPLVKEMTSCAKQKAASLLHNGLGQ